MKSIISWFLVLALLSAAPSALAQKRSVRGAQSKQAQNSCPMQSVSNEAFTASLTPVRDEIGRGWMGFVLTIRNKTDKPLEVSWNDTRYLEHGQPSGGFSLESLPQRTQDTDRKSLLDNKPSMKPMVVPPGETVAQAIFPDSRLDFSGQKLGWTRQSMLEGMQGLDLAVKVDNKPMTQRIMLNVADDKSVCGIQERVR